MQPVTIILPTRNEEEAIHPLIQEIQIQAQKHGWTYQIIISDASTDNTIKHITKNSNITIIQHNKKGYGNAIREGIRHAKYDTIVTLDGDYSYDPRNIQQLLHAYDNNLVLGVRTKKEQQSMPSLHQYIGNPLLTAIINKKTKQKLTDTQTGMRVFSKQTYLQAAISATQFEHCSEQIITYARNNIPIVEVDITYRKRKGTSKLKTIRDGIHILYSILRT